MFDVEHLIKSGGILVVALIVFAESGLLIGFFLPGDTLLFAAGLAAANGDLPLLPLIVAIIVAAVVGDNVGYSIGRRTGSRLFTKKDGLIFRQEYIERASEFYEKHGGKTIILARFTPVVRTFAPVVAGASKMNRERFMLFNVVGGILWGAGMTLLGFFVGDLVPGLDKYMEKAIIAVVSLSILIAIGHALRDEKIRNALWHRLKRNLMLNRRPKDHDKIA